MFTIDHKLDLLREFYGQHGKYFPQNPKRLFVQVISDLEIIENAMD